MNVLEDRKSKPRIAIIGGGMAGILCAVRLKAEGMDNFSIYEKADRLGGTWRDNSYPGIACDVPSHAYRYSFEPNPEWSRVFSPGPEILAYFENVAARHGLGEKVRLGTEITRCEFNGRWLIYCGDQLIDEADFIVAATGVLHHPAYPDIDGIDSFAGRAFHSARWDHGVALDNCRFGVIGSASSAIQIVPAVVDRVAKMTMFQRTPQWIMPVDNPPYTEEERAAFRSDPATMDELSGEWLRRFTERFSDTVIDVSSPAMKALEDFCRSYLESKVKDPALLEKLHPNYRAACKRLVASPDFYDAIQHPNAELVTDRIVRIEPSGVRTEDGRLHELDVLVYATGFQVDRFLRPMTVVGRSGKRLDDLWANGPVAYLSIAVPDFPNLFMLNGPNGPVGNISLIEVAEQQVAYVLQFISRFRAGEFREVCATREATDRFNAERVEKAKRTVWYSGCKSWYLDKNGIPAIWPFSYARFSAEMKEPRLADYQIVP